MPIEDPCNIKTAARTSALSLTISKFVYFKKIKDVLSTVSHMGFEPTILRSRVHGESGHPWW